MKGFPAIFKRELRGYLSTPTAYVFLTAFLFAANLWTFRNGFFEMNEASLRLFFVNMPLLMVLFAPALAMRLWSEERRSHTMELLFSLPVTVRGAVLGKFAAAWTVLLLGLVLTFPLVLTVHYLGAPPVPVLEAWEENPFRIGVAVSYLGHVWGHFFGAGGPEGGPILTGYLGSLLLAGAFLAIGGFFSALTRSQVIAFVLAVVFCGGSLWIGQPSVLQIVIGVLPEGMATVAETLSYQYRFDALLRGVLEIRDILFFVLMTAGWLVATMILLKERKAA